MGLNKINKICFKNQTCYRLIPSKFPPIYLFEDVADTEDFEALYAVQNLTNPRIQDEIGNIKLVPEGERLFGIPHCSYVMAAFTHVNPDGSRFSNGDYGIYYAAEKIETAIAETVYRQQKFLKYTHEPPQDLDMRSLVATFSAALFDIREKEYLSTPFYDKVNLGDAQSLGYKVKQTKGDGVTYNSVRAIGVNFALFKPNLINKCNPSAHYGYLWNGHKIESVYEKKVVI